MENGMNICLLNDSFPPLIDGVSNTVLNYARIIQSSHGKATVVTPKYPRVKDNYPFDVVRYPSMDIVKRVGYRAGNPFYAPVLNSLADRNFNIIHCHCPMASALLARSLREISGVPIVFTYHTKFDIDIRRAVRSELIQKKVIEIVVDNVESCDEVWVVSEGAGKNLRELGYKGSYSVMENGVDFPRGRASEELIASVNSAHGLEDGTPVFLFVGRLMWYKGIRLILNALKKAKDDGFRFRMLFVGDGLDRPKIEKYTEELSLTEECVFVGAIRDRELLRGYFTAADLFLFPSTFDTNGIVVREAAACGLASLIIKDSCAAEGITDRDTGLLVGEDSDSIAEVVEEVCKDSGEAHRIGQNAMDKIYISWEDSVAKAYGRYAAVVENYRLNGRNTDNVNLKNEKFFCDIAETCEKLRRVHSIYLNMKNKAKDVFR